MSKFAQKVATLRFVTLMMLGAILGFADDAAGDGGSIGAAAPVESTDAGVETGTEHGADNEQASEVSEASENDSEGDSDESSESDDPPEESDSEATE